MRLINSSTLEFEEFFGSQIPLYAILSHTWETHEILYEDYYPLDELRHKQGSEKILKTCELAHGHGLHYVWIDTCCINKGSSAELTESINSMFRWYSKAERCYIYLSDYGSQDSEFKCSRWFTRGWTLQELIAPIHAYFFDRDWKYIGSKVQLADAITSRTGISKGVLTNVEDCSKVSVAQKMSWAARRKTTREED